MKHPPPMRIQAFVITNGRSTLEYCLKSLKNQSVSIPVTVIRDLSWKDALASCVEQCKEPWLLRIDDDFILYPDAVEYIWSVVLASGGWVHKTKIVMFSFKLWETWTDVSTFGVKIYHMDALRSIGGFRFCERGKTDKQTVLALGAAGFKHHKDLSIVGLHSCGTWDEQLCYEGLWGHKKPTRIQMQKYVIDLKTQSNLCGSFLVKMNMNNRSGFGKFLERKELNRMDIRSRIKDYLVDMTQGLQLDNFPVQDVVHLLNNLLKVYQEEKNVITMGNGGSGLLASHLVQDLAKHVIVSDTKSEVVVKKRFKAICLSDCTSTLTTWANDVGYDDVFSQMLENFVGHGDVVIGFTSSGNSENVIRALKKAKEYGATTIAMTGPTGGEAGKNTDICVHVNSSNGYCVEDIHQCIIHIVTDILRDIIQGKTDTCQTTL